MTLSEAAARRQKRLDCDSAEGYSRMKLDCRLVMNPFRRHLMSKAQSAMIEADALDRRSHAGLKGELRENLLKRLLEEVLPPEIKVGRGQLVSQHGMLSSQVDSILYAPTILPPALYDAENGFFPAECCLYAIEVKTKLTAARLAVAIASAKKIRSLPLLLTEHWSPPLVDGALPTSTVCRTFCPICAIFAFDSDLKGDPQQELQRYSSLDQDSPPSISVICIRGRGYWYYTPYGTWQHTSATSDLDEILMFLAGLTNTIPQLLVAKGRPRVGNYLFP